jgi:hypothetical protein
MLLAGPRNAFDSLKRRPLNVGISESACYFQVQNLTHLVFQSLEHQVHRFEPHCYGSIDFSCRLVDEDALPDSILGQISIEVSLRFI